MTTEATGSKTLRVVVTHAKNPQCCIFRLSSPVTHYSIQSFGHPFETIEKRQRALRDIGDVAAKIVTAALSVPGVYHVAVEPKELSILAVDYFSWEKEIIPRVLQILKDAMGEKHIEVEREYGPLQDYYLPVVLRSRLMLDISRPFRTLLWKRKSRL